MMRGWGETEVQIATPDEGTDEADNNGRHTPLLTPYTSLSHFNFIFIISEGVSIFNLEAIAFIGFWKIREGRIGGCFCFADKDSFGPVDAIPTHVLKEGEGQVRIYRINLA